MVLKRGFGSSLEFCGFLEREFWPLRGFLNTGSGSRALLPPFTPLCDRNLTGTWGLATGFALSKKMGAANQSTFDRTFDGKASPFLDYEQRVTL